MEKVWVCQFVLNSGNTFCVDSFHCVFINSLGMLIIVDIVLKMAETENGWHLLNADVFYWLWSTLHVGKENLY